MLTYRLDHIDNGIISYFYYPEGDEGRVGHIKVNADGSLAEPWGASDKLDEFDRDWYGRHMYKRIREFCKSGHYEQSGSIVWY